VKELTVQPKRATSLHRHAVKDETFYIVSGVVELEIQTDPGEKSDLLSVVMWPGSMQRIAPGQFHRLTNRFEKPCVILECSSHHEDADVERREPSRAL
jgi:mannose-6-phosphate isomerase-like protein (cupin superfamily)